MKNWVNVQIIGPVRELTKQYGKERSPEWHKVRGLFLLDHPVCEVCERKDLQLNVHHCIPFHLNPELELEPSNLITLCRDHHFFMGHLLSWHSWNPDIRQDAIEWRLKIQSRPKKN